MIAVWALRLGIAQWLVKAALALLLMLTLIGGGAWIHHHIYHSGELAQKVRDDALAKIESDRADAERDRLNLRIAAVQADLAKARDRVAELNREYENEKTVSDARQRDLLAGRERMRILARTRPPGANGPTQGGTAAGMDPGSAVVVDIDPAVASNLERFRSERNRAAVALDACIVDYDALKSAVDALP